MKKSRRLGPIAVLAVGALALTSCAPEAPPERVSIVMGMASGDTYTAEWWGWLAASNLGYYDELGLDVEFQGVGGSGDVVEQLVAGTLMRVTLQCLLLVKVS